MKTPSSQIAVDRFHGGNGPDDCVDFSASLNPLGPPPEAIQAYYRAATKISRYPSPYPQQLEERIASWLGVQPETVIVANGSTQLIYLVARVLRLKSPFIVIPTFSEIANALHASGSHPGPIFTNARDDFRLSHATLREALETGADAVFMGRPNSPTGILLDLEETAAIARDCARRDAWCVVDEAFIEFGDDPRSAACLIGSNPKLIVLRSLTKIFAVPGLRLGYLLGSARLVRELRNAIEPWSVNAIAEEVGFACLNVADDFIAHARRFVEGERSWLMRKLASLPAMRVFASQANFLMFGISAEQTRGEFGRHMRDHKLVIRDLDTLPGCGPGMYRVCVRSRTENQRLVAVAEEYFGVGR